MGFGIGSIGTIIGTLVAYAIFPLRGMEDGWKVASALCGRHIGMYCTELFSIMWCRNFELNVLLGRSGYELVYR